jgi:hypothetical protein
VTDLVLCPVCWSRFLTYDIDEFVIHLDTHHTREEIKEAIKRCEWSITNMKAYLENTSPFNV